MHEFKTKRSHGFTLLELVVVIAILSIVGVMILPSLRSLNEDRKVRDTARVVGAVFAAARERATVDGQAGVEITSIPNADQFYNLPNMGLVLYQLRAIPAYSGDQNAATVQVNSSLQLINPVGANFLAQEIATDDRIELNNSGVRLRIVRDDNNTPSNENDDKFFIENPLPNPPIPTVPLPFKVYRQPVRIESSAVRLPNNLFVNLAFSGCTVGGDEFLLPDGSPYASTQVWFANDGSIYSVSRLNVTDPLLRAMVPANSPVNLLMCSANRESADLTQLQSTDFIRDDNSMWITIDNRTGGVTMGKMAQITDLNASRPEQIRESQLLARDRRSATP